jgi:hypothetical protein
MAPSQQPFPSLLDVIGHFPPAQQVILLAESFDIMEQVLPSLPWQQLPLLQHEPDLLSHFDPLPQQAVFPPVESWLQQAQALALLSSVDGLVCEVLCAISARAITRVLASMRAFDFMVSSEYFRWAEIVSASRYRRRPD